MPIGKLETFFKNKKGFTQDGFIWYWRTKRLEADSQYCMTDDLMTEYQSIQEFSRQVKLEKL